MDIGTFFKQNPELCHDITSNFSPHFKFLDGNKVPVKITEYGPEMLKQIKWQSGFNDDFLLK